MERDALIDLRGVEMHFNMSRERLDSLKEYALRLAKGRLLYEDFTALAGIDLAVRRGDVLGVVGLNGSGKSTLLKIVSGILRPTRGTVRVEGTVAPLIELGAGFDLELTARENIFLNGAVLGHSKREMRARFEEIVEFSGMRGFLDVPMKNYSTGMVARIAFSVATCVRPDILLVDEILSVGDHQFVKKCEERIAGMMAEGTTVFLVSHDLAEVRRLCTRAIWLERGRIRAEGPADAVCAAYEAGG